MCGISGIFSKNNNVTKETLQSMALSMAHRGPDGEGTWIDSSHQVGFAHRRLSVIDLSEQGRQPMQYLNRYTITYNGEIYNFRDIKRELQLDGYKFSNNTDTEVILALYDKLGSACLNLLDGMFAFAIWDEKKKELFIARDRFGEKPLFYGFLNGDFYFASEMKVLFRCGISKKFSPDRVYKYLQGNVFVDEEDPGSTFYEGIRQLDAACYMLVRSAKIEEISNYWSIENIPIRHDLTIDKASEEFISLLSESLSLRTRSEVKLGVCISGGIDSSSIVFTLESLINSNLVNDCFSARFDNFERDEYKFINKVLSSFPKYNPHFVWPSVDGFIEDLEKLAFAQEEPFYSGSIYNHYCVMRMAYQKGVTVLLEGQGADELLGGYNHYYQHHLTYLFIHNYKKYLSERNAYDRILGELYPYRVPRRLPIWYIKKILAGAKFIYDEPVRNLLVRDSTKTGLKALLRYGDRNSMAFGREIRLPFLSHKLAEFLFSLPIEFILNDGWTKYILRRAMEGIVPGAITWRRDKIGFEPPQNLWVNALSPVINKFKRSVDYREFTSGRKVDEVVDWKWLMLKLFFSKDAS